MIEQPSELLTTILGDHHRIVLADATRESASALLETDDALALCAGHFPDEPLIPGAYLMGLAVDLARRMGAVAGVEHATFRAPLRPEGPVRLHARRVGEQVHVELGSAGADVAAKCRIATLARPWPPLGLELGFEDHRNRDPNRDRDHEDPSDPGRLDHAAVRAALRHREPALFVDRELRADPPVREYSALSRPTWHWTQLLDGAAQAAGLDLRKQAREPIAAVYVAAFERVRWAQDLFEAPPCFRVRLRRRVMNLVQFEVVVVSAEPSSRDSAWLQAELALAAVPVSVAVPGVAR